MRWVGKVQYHENEGWAELFWWPEILPHLTGLLHDITHSMAADVVAPQSAETVIHIIS